MASEVIAPASESRASKMIRETLESGRPLTYVRSVEEQRVVRLLDEVAARMGGDASVPVWAWTLTEGLRRGAAGVEEGTKNPRAALDFIVAHRGAGIFHLKDFHEALRESAEVRRRLRDVHESCLDQRKFVVISSAVRYVPEELDRSILFMELRPPDLAELAGFVREEAGETREEILQQVARALQGLTLDEARYALRRALAS